MAVVDAEPAAQSVVLLAGQFFNLHYIRHYTTMSLETFHVASSLISTHSASRIAYHRKHRL